MNARKRYLLFALTAAALACCLVALFALCPRKKPQNGPVPTRPGQSNVKQPVVKKNAGKFAPGNKTVPEEKPKPDISDALNDDAVKMSDAYKALLVEIQAVLDADDKQGLIKLVQRMQDSNEWPDGIPKSLHLAAIEAMKWFGVSIAPELIGYLGSSDQEVVESTLDAMLEAISDSSISDSERSSMLLNYVSVVKDADTLDMMMMELDNMRPTIRAKTAMSIYESGNAAAIKVLNENIEFFFSDLDGVEVTKPGDLKDYYSKAEEAYATDPELAETDEDFYGGDKN